MRAGELAGGSTSAWSPGRGRSSATTASLIILVSLALALFVFRDALLELVRRWNVQEEYSHGYFIPVIALWLVWTRRDAVLGSIGFTVKRTNCTTTGYVPIYKDNERGSYVFSPSCSLLSPLLALPSGSGCSE